MTVAELKIYTKLESDPTKACIAADGHVAYIAIEGGVQCIYSGGRDINDLSKEEFDAFVWNAAISG